MLLKHEQRICQITSHISDLAIKDKVVRGLTSFLATLDQIDDDPDCPPKLEASDLTPKEALQKEELRISKIIIEEEEDVTPLQQPPKIAVPLEINIRGKYGYTPLIVATLNDNKEEVISLLAQGADPNIGDNSGMTAYDKALIEGFDDIAAILRPYVQDEGTI